MMLYFSALRMRAQTRILRRCVFAAPRRSQVVRELYGSACVKPLLCLRMASLRASMMRLAEGNSSAKAGGVGSTRAHTKTSQVCVNLLRYLSFGFLGKFRVSSR